MAAAAVLHQRSGAMAADIVEGAHRAVLAADGHDGVAGKGRREVVARPRQLAFMGEQLPAAREDLTAFGLVNARVAIELRGQRFGGGLAHPV